MLCSDDDSVLRVRLASLFNSQCRFLPIYYILCSCHSTCSLALPQNHNGPETCLHRAIHIYSRPWFGRLGICISYIWEHFIIKSNGLFTVKFLKLCLTKHGVWIRYGCFLHLLSRFPSDRCFCYLEIVYTNVACKTCVVACLATSIKAGKMLLLCGKLCSN